MFPNSETMLQALICLIYASLFIKDAVKAQTRVSFFEDTNDATTYQIYEVTSSTLAETESICSRCSTGSLVQVKSEAKWTSLMENLFLPAGISGSASFWLGLQSNPISSVWIDGQPVTWSAWTINHPVPGTSGTTCEIDEDGGPLWVSHPAGYTLTDNPLVVCQYDATKMGYDTWTGWSLCDYTRELRTRFRPCMSPTSDPSTGCTCEDRQIKNDVCSTEGNFELMDGTISYQMYSGRMTWTSAFHVCRRCASGYIAMPKNASQSQSVLDMSLGKDHFLGLWDPDDDGIWTWLDGENVTFSNWHASSPDSDLEKFVAFADNKAEWNNIDPDEMIDNGIICQYDATAAGTYAEWGPWGVCDTLGTRQRWRRCKSPAPDATTGCSCDTSAIVEEDNCSISDQMASQCQDGFVYLLFDAPGVTGRQAESFCNSYFGPLSRNLVMYQNLAKYTSIHDNLIKPAGYNGLDHWVGLSHTGNEKTWAWHDGTVLNSNWSWWVPGSPSHNVLLDSAILTANSIPFVRDASSDSFFHQDSADFIICEFFYENSTGDWFQWATWGSWSACFTDDVAGNGTQNRTKKCSTSASTITSQCCIGTADEERSCQDTTPQLPNICLCPGNHCHDNSSQSLEDIISDLVQNLTIDRHNTSAARRRLVCAGDSRWSAKGLGLTIGISVIVIWVSILIAFDASKFGCNCKRNSSSHRSNRPGRSIRRRVDL